MRMILFVLAAFTLLVPGSAAAQDWIEFASREDFFSVNFPGQPKVESITYISTQEAPLPGRVYSAERGAGLLGFMTPMHGDEARGHGVEKEWD